LPKIERTADDIAANCWTLSEAKAFLEVAKAAGPRPAAFYAVALDTGVRLGELCGLKWADFDLDARKVSIVRQLVSSTLGPDGSPQFGPTKTGKSGTVDLGADTVSLLKALKAHQATVKMANRTTYRDAGLVFTKEDGAPIQRHNINNREFGDLIKRAEVRRIVFHGLRHTSATLLLLAGVPAKVVSERLGHSKNRGHLGHVLARPAVNGGGGGGTARGLAPRLTVANKLLRDDTQRHDMRQYEAHVIPPKA
jgi:integrase